METSKLHRYLAFVTLAILLFMFIDTFFTGTRSHIEIIKSGDVVIDRSSKSGTRMGATYYLNTTNEKSYKVPVVMYGALETGDSFAIHNTRLLHTPVAFSWRHEGHTYTAKAGILNSGFFGPAFFIFGIASAILILFFPTLIKKKNINERLIFSAVSFTIMMFIFYLLQ